MAGQTRFKYWVEHTEQDDTEGGAKVLSDHVFDKQAFFA